MRSIFVGVFLQLRRKAIARHTFTIRIAAEARPALLLFFVTGNMSCRHHRQRHWFVRSFVHSMKLCQCSVFNVSLCFLLIFFLYFTVQLSFIPHRFFFSVFIFFFVSVFIFFSRFILVALFFYLSFTLRFTCWSRCVFLRFTYTISHPRRPYHRLSPNVRTTTTMNSSTLLCLARLDSALLTVYVCNVYIYIYIFMSICIVFYTRDFLFVFLFILAYHSHAVFHLPRAPNSKHNFALALVSPPSRRHNGASIHSLLDLVAP